MDTNLRIVCLFCREQNICLQEPKVGTSKKRGKENSSDGPMNSQSPISCPNDKQAKKVKQEGVKRLKERVEDDKDNGVVCSPIKHTVVIGLRRSPRKLIIPQEITKKEEVVDDKDNVRRSPRKFNAPQEVTKNDEKMSDINCGKVTKKVKKEKVQAEPKVKSGKHQKDINIDHVVVDVVLPPGSLLTNVAGIDLLPDDIGHALQFLEFCSAFREVIYGKIFLVCSNITVFLGAHYKVYCKTLFPDLLLTHG